MNRDTVLLLWNSDRRRWEEVLGSNAQFLKGYIVVTITDFPADCRTIRLAHESCYDQACSYYEAEVAREQRLRRAGRLI